MSSASVASGPDPGSLLDGPALRVAFTAPATSQVQKFDGVRRHREHRRKLIHLERRGAVVGEGVSQFEKPARVQGEVAGHGDSGVGIGLNHDGGSTVRRRAHRAKAEGEIKAGYAVGNAVATQSGPALPTRGSLRQEPCGDVGVDGGRRNWLVENGQVRQGLAQVGSPVGYLSLSAVGADHQAGTCGTEMERVHV